MNLPTTRFSRRIDPWLTRIGDTISWLWLLLMAIVVLNVVLRYAFGEGHIELEEIQWHLYSLGFLLGLSYAYQSDSHIRVDVLYERYSPRTRAWIELYGIVLLALPFALLFLIFSVPFVIASFELAESSQSPGGLPYRWLIKAALPIGFGLLIAAICSRLSRVSALLFLSHGANIESE